jgi:hypothetical protein
MSHTMHNRRGWFLALSCLAMLAPGAGAVADEPKKTVDAGGMTFKAPESWKSIETTSQMRKAQLHAEPVKGDDYGADLVVFVFPTGAGTVDANVKRWQSQFKDAEGNPPKVESKKVKGKNVEVTRVETSGHYTPSRFPGVAPEPERDNARLLGAIVVTDNGSYFLKMVGPDKTMTTLRPAFDDLISSIEVEGK